MAGIKLLRAKAQQNLCRELKATFANQKQRFQCQFLGKIPFSDQKFMRG